jgi:hypothetical protein
MDADPHEGRRLDYHGSRPPTPHANPKRAGSVGKRRKGFGDPIWRFAESLRFACLRGWRRGWNSNSGNGSHHLGLLLRRVH